MNLGSISTADDGQLVREVARGDVQAFKEIYDRHSAQAFGLALYVTKQATVAEEVTQDAFLGLWRSASGFDPQRAAVRTWLLSMVRNRGIDALRKHAKQLRDVEFDESIAERLESPDRPDEQVVQQEDLRHTRDLLSILPAKQRQVIELGFFRGLSQTEIATKIGVPVGTVKGRQRLALEKLHERLMGARQPILAS
jgi:RNA polymerase sigma-70 factor (ECF subfamily)